MVDSRQADDGLSIRRRRQCETCGARFTTFERLEEAPLVVVKRDGRREPFDRSKVAAGVAAALKGRPVEVAGIEALVTAVEDRLRVLGRDAKTDDIGTEVLTLLRGLDGVAAVRFASVYKDFDDVTDFEREITLLDEGDGYDDGGGYDEGASPSPSAT